MNAALTRGRWLLLAAAGVAAACSDAAGPIRPAPRFGAAAAGTTGITLDQFSGIANDPEPWGQGQTHVGKNFVANPHRGDAVVATFFWRGSSNTIVGVTDHLCDVNNTPVGNTYTLVDYATQGGYSMATYVATNIQNFPDPAPTSDQLLCVHAIFSNQLSEAGMIISAYQGVDPNAATALGAHRTASGSASTTSPEGPGPIPVGGGALAYAATVSAPIGTDPPAGFTDLTEVDDNVDKADAEYEVFPGGGTADPTWTWYFTSPQAWLAEDLALNPATGTTNQPPTAAFGSSCSGLTCAFTSTSSDPDGSISSYAWTFGDGGTAGVANPGYTYAAGGTYTVTLTVTDNQGATSSVSHTVTVSGGNQPPVASFTSSCGGLTCQFTSTSSDPDGTVTAYSWSFGDGATSTAQNPTHTYAVGGTTYTVTLTVTDNQGATASVSQPRHVRRR
ncbi:MAG TPA: PKD domain-containing protein [Gemmatimonadales bacterium]